MPAPTPTERLEERKRLADCRVCAWLETVSDQERREWAKAIADRRFGAELVASEIMAEVGARDLTGQTAYNGPTIGEASVSTHRQRGHK